MYDAGYHFSIGVAADSNVTYTGLFEINILSNVWHNAGSDYGISAGTNVFAYWTTNPDFVSRGGAGPIYPVQVITGSLNC